MIATIATVVEIELRSLSQRSLSQRLLRSPRSLKSGFRMNATIAELFFSDRGDRRACSDHMETSL